MTDEQLTGAMHKAVMAEVFFLAQPDRGDVFSWLDDHPELMTAALAALRETHHLVPRAAGDDGELVGRLRKIGERVPVVCPDGIKGCLVFHFRVETDPTCAEAADAITALSAEVERLRAEWQFLLDTLEKNTRETGQPDRVLWKGVWYDGPLAEAYHSTFNVIRKLARKALGAKP